MAGNSSRTDHKTVCLDLDRSEARHNHCVNVIVLEMLNRGCPHA